MPIVTLPPEFVNARKLKPGQNAEVYRATHRLLARDVFLKVYEVSPTDPQSALREPQLLQQLRHPNLVTIHSARELADSRVLLEMELLPGGSAQDLLDQWHQARKWPPIHRCVAIVAGVANGLGHMHSHGYVHRDVKPANIMIRTRGKDQDGVLTDLGLAARLGDDGRTQASKHSRLYRPPEVWEGRGYSRASDVYQLGLVLAQFLGARMRYELSHLSDADLAREIRQGSVLDWNVVLPHATNRLVNVARTAVEYELGRYPSVSAMLVALEHARTSQQNWSYTARDDGFDCERVDRGRTRRVSCDVDGRRQRITPRQRLRAGGMRRCGTELLLPAKVQLRTNRKFQAMLRKT